MRMLKIRYFITLLGLVLTFGKVKCHISYFVSTFHTASLVEEEHRILAMLQEYTNNVENRIANLKEAIQKYLVELKTLEQNEISTEHSPLHGYLLMKRLTVDLDNIQQLLIDPHVAGIYSNLTAMKEAKKLPDRDDYDGATAGLVRLQFTYSLNTTSMVRGVLESNGNKQIPSIDTSASLSAQDCFLLGQHSFRENLLKQSVDWFEEAIVKAETDPNTSSLDILPHLEAAVNRLASPDLNSKDVIPIENSNPMLFEEYLPENIETHQYRSLCRGERLRPHSLDKNLYCEYFPGNDAFFLLNPIELEVLSIDPYIVVLQNVINDRQIGIIKDISTPKLARSTHFGANGSFERSLLRTSANAWLTDGEHPEVQKLTHKLSMITGLAADHLTCDAEWYQVANYGIGGHYAPHHDYLQMKTDAGAKFINNDDFTQKAGDRIATFMFYLTDVEAGGATVFPTIGISIFPKKGSAAFWWNLKRNGEGDHLTKHGACPVLYGSKWVANKWFRSNSQMFRKPCTITNDNEEKFDIL